MESLATFIASGTTINSRSMKFPAGSVNEKLLEIPLGFIAPHATIRITTGLQPPTDGTDHDPFVGLSDGTNSNHFAILDTNNYASLAACLPRGAASQDDNRVLERDSNPAQAVMIFRPIEKYGACYLPMDSGYVNTATFNQQLDLQGGLSLTLYRDNAPEQYTIYYFIVDIFK